jgi:acylphosphatase
MNKCLRILITAKFSDDLLRSFIHKNAKMLGLEGTAQIIDPAEKKVRISVCGSTEALDEFIDLLHKGTKGFDLKDIEIVPFLKDKDYRSVFRVIE